MRIRNIKFFAYLKDPILCCVEMGYIHVSRIILPVNKLPPILVVAVYKKQAYPSGSGISSIQPRPTRGVTFPCESALQSSTSSRKTGAPHEKFPAFWNGTSLRLTGRLGDMRKGALPKYCDIVASTNLIWHPLGPLKLPIARVCQRYDSEDNQDLYVHTLWMAA